VLHPTFTVSECSVHDHKEHTCLSVSIDLDKHVVAKVQVVSNTLVASFRGLSDGRKASEGLTSTARNKYFSTDD
jgi:hypothetical protein